MALKSSEINKYALYGPLSGIGIALPLSYLTAFQTEGLGWSAVLATTVLIAPRVIDFILGITCGTIMSKINMKWGRYRSWFVVLRWAVTASIVMQFLDTKALPLALQILFIALGYLILNSSMNFLLTAQYGIMFMMGGASMEDRQKLSIRANQFTVAGTILTSAALVPALQALTKSFYPENTNPNWYGSKAFMILAIVCAVCYYLGATCIISAAKDHDKPAPGGAGGPTTKIGDVIKSVVTNDQLLIYTLVTTLTSISLFAMMPIGIFYYMYVLKNMMLMPIAMTIVTLFGLLASIIGPQIGRKIGMKRSMVIGMVIAICGSLVTANFAGNDTPSGLRLVGMDVPVGWIIYLLVMLIGSLAAQMYAGFAMQFQVNAGEYGYYKTGKDNRTAAMGLGAVPMKIALIVGGALGGYALAGIGYQPGMGMPGGPEFPANFTVNFMRLIGYVPAAISLVALLLFGFGYKITDEKAKFYAEENMKKTMANMASQLQSEAKS
ncbi:MAG: MFS transporter [Spirochaetaceae bacterium]|nr:MFS transporter [Spirochaetaceae bacterium]